MSSRDPDDGLDARLAALPMTAPDASRAQRVRARCRAALSARELAAARSRRRLNTWTRVVAPALVGGFCAVYLSALVFDVLASRLTLRTGGKVGRPLR